MYAAFVSLVFLLSAAFVQVTKTQIAVREAAQVAAYAAFHDRIELGMPIDETELRQFVAEKLKSDDFGLQIDTKVFPKPTGGPGPGSQVTVFVSVGIPWYTSMTCASTINLE